MLVPMVDRAIYPEDEFPAGQWDYQLYYEEHFEDAQRVFEANAPVMVWSAGPDRMIDPNAANELDGKATRGVNKDNVLSWK